MGYTFYMSVIHQDDSSYVEESSPETKWTTSETIRTCQLTSTITIPEKEALTSRAAKRIEATNPSLEWAGKSTEKLGEEFIRFRNEALAELGINPKVAFAKLSEQETEQVAIKVASKLRGEMGELFASQFSLQECETVEVVLPDNEAEAKMLRGIGKWKVKDIAQIYGTVRKDIILAGLKVASMESDADYISKTAAEFGVDESDVKKVIDATAAAYTNYQSLEKQYNSVRNKNTPFNKREALRIGFAQKLNQGTTVQSAELNRVFDKVVADAEKVVGKNVYSLLDELNNRSSPEKSPAEIEAETAVRNWQTENRQSDSGIPELGRDIAVADTRRLTEERSKRFENLTEDKLKNELAHYNGWNVVPDAVCGDGDNISVIVEVKTYSKEQVDAWIKAKYTTIGMNDPSEEGYIVNGLQITSLNKGVSMTYGLDIEAERHFANLNNGSTEDQPIPVVIRLPNDITDEQFKHLSYLTQLDGYSNVIFQRMPVSTETVNLEALKLMSNLKRQIVSNARTASQRYNPQDTAMALDEKIVSLLTKPATWEKSNA